ncbi:MAG TPA: PKD domain-containing protein [Puia sp.]|jgi:gliding motility-associated-like protein
MPLFPPINKYLSRLLPAVVLFLAVNPARAQLNANFTADRMGGCSPLSVSFTNTTTGASANATYSWDLGNGRTSVLANPGSVYTTEQSYTVTLTVKDGSLTSTKSVPITVYKKPTVDFNVTPAQGCVPLPVVFNSQSQAGDGSLSNYFWDFGDGATQQGGNLSQVSHVYLFSQNASVSLTVTNSNGCYNTLQKAAVVISPAIKAGFTAGKTTLCQTGDAVQFTNTSTGSPLTYDWNFGDGVHSTDQDPTHAYTQKGVYTVILTITSPTGGCTDVSTQTNLIHVADFNTDFSWPDPVCLNTLTTFTDKSTPSPTISDWQYDAGPMLPGYFYIFGTTGTHTVTLTNTFGTCQQSITKTVNVQPAPTLKDFTITPEGICGAPLTVAFSDTSTTTVRWQWSFDQANATANTRDAVYTYTIEGTYFPQLMITNSTGCSASFSKPIQVFKPQIFLSYNNSTSASGNISCTPFSMTFTASSGNDPITQYNWDFGDGGHSTDATPTHTFSTTGTYIIHLAYTTAGGCQGTAEYSSVRLYQKPVAQFNISPGATICGNNPVRFIDQTQGPVSSWSWNFGDNTPLNNVPSPGYQYSADGTYTITLIVSNDLCSDTLSKSVQVLPPFPKIGAVINTCDNTRGLVTFTQATVKGVSWAWDFGDGATLPLNTDQQTVAHTYTRTGVYKVVLTATNGNCTVRDSTFPIVLLKQQPVLTAFKQTVCASDTLGVNIVLQDPNPVGYDYFNPYGYTFAAWQYADGSSFTGSDSPPGVPFGGNSYTGTLSGLMTGENGLRAILLSKGFGCQDTTNFIPLTIRGPSAAFTITTNNVCFHSPIVLQDASHSNNNVPIVSWQWGFGDNQSLMLSQPGSASHTYSNPGYYWPALTVTDQEGCTATTPYSAQAIRVNGPQAAFSWSPTIVSPGTQLFFYNSTNTSGSSFPQYQWTFGDGSGTTTPYPYHTYSSIGTDTVTLIAKDAISQCADTNVQVIYVKTVHASFGYTTTYINNNTCPPVVLHFANTSTNSNSVSWDFGDGSVADNQTYPSHTYYQPGLYKVVLHSYGNNNATDSFVSLVTIKGPYATLKADTLSGCTGQTVTLSALVQSASSFTWDFGDGTLTNSSDTFAIHTYLTGGVYTPALIMQDADGCRATSALDNPVIIDSLHIGLDNIPSHVCDSTLLVLDPLVRSIAAQQLQQTLRYKWDFGTGMAGDTSIAASPSFTWHRSGQYPVSLQVSSPYGCRQTVTNTLLVVDPQPFIVQMTKDTLACPGMPLQLMAKGAASYHWLTATGLSDPNVPDPVARPPLENSYTVVGYDQYTCFADTATVKITMTSSPTVDAGPDLQVPTGATLPLSVTGSSDIVSWTWSPPDYLSCTDCASPICTPRSSMQYIVTGKTQYGCPASDTLNLKLICDEGRVYIANSFTPNGDGKNDVFYIKGSGIRIINYLRIFNRWGEIIFERGHFNIDDRSAGWDGAFKGHPVETGTYVYVTEMVCDNGEVFPLKGTFTLVR